ncbi:hypothetical protein AALP_AA3G016000 [Arabis alpina]|uniref:Uncharacterized protein n=1 Tax=Arabis alpina TaxID=50452 RepID=A0A087H6D8_ARAAL|nr:hypothetical protein AALP_AA3G016000 [Arabis alpina]
MCYTSIPNLCRKMTRLILHLYNNIFMEIFSSME